MKVSSEIDWDLPDPFSIHVEVGVHAVDRLGHVNNTVYLGWCEQVACEHADAVGAGWDLWQELDRAMAVRAVRLEYLVPAMPGDELLVGNWIVKNDGRLRATRRFQIVRPSDGRTLLRGDIDYVCIEISTGRPKRLPPRFLDAYVVLESVREALA